LNDLCTGAVLGTDRAGSIPAQIDGKLGTLLEKVAHTDDTARFLRTAAAASVYSRAGTTCLPTKPETTESAPPDQDIASAAAGRLLSQILDDGPADLLPEWCQLAAGAGVRAPDELLPALLARFDRDPDHAHASPILSVLGARGLWLARRNPEWWGAILPFEEPETAWQTGGLDQRARALRCLRTRHPTHARELLVNAWSQEEPSDRSKLLAQLDEGLSLDDAPFLESVLDEKGVAIRRTSAGLLGRLPESKYCERMAKRTSTLVSIKHERALLKRRKTIDVILPEPGDKTYARDGIEFKAKGKLGTKAHALLQMIAATPLSTWDALGTGPKELIAAVKETEWAQAILCGWSRAAVSQRDGQWAEALLIEYFAHVDPEASEIELDEVAELMSVFDTAGRERIITSSTPKDIWGSAMFRAFLHGCNHEWSNELSLTLIDSLRKHLRRTQGGFDEGLRRLVTGWVALRLDPKVADEAGTAWPIDKPYWTQWLADMISQLTSVVNFRRQLHEEFGK